MWFTSIDSTIWIFQIEFNINIYQTMRKNVRFGVPKTIVCIKVGENMNESMSWAEWVFSKWENAIYLWFSLDFVCLYVVFGENAQYFDLNPMPIVLPTCFSFVTGHEFQWCVSFIAYSRSSLIPFHISYFSKSNISPYFQIKSFRECWHVCWLQQN